MSLLVHPSSAAERHRIGIYDQVMVATSKRPRVVVHASISIDGRLALAPDRLLMTDDRWPVDAAGLYRSIMDLHHPQVLLEGSGSFVTPDAGPADLPPTDRTAAELRTTYLPEAAVDAASAGWLVVVDGRGRVRWAYKQFPDEAWAGWHLLVLVRTSTPLPYLAFLRREGIPYLIAGDEQVDLALALAQLADLGVTTVAATAGGHLTGALLRAGVVDEIALDIAPIAVGGTTAPSLFTAPDLTPDQQPTKLDLIELGRQDNGRPLLRYAVTRS